MGKLAQKNDKADRISLCRRPLRASEPFMKKKSPSQKKEEKLKKDLKKLIDHWKKFLEESRLHNDKHFLAKIAKDIKKLDEEASLSLEMPELYPASYLIHHFLISPYGAAFMTNRSLLDAALAFSSSGEKEMVLTESDTAQESDLSSLLEDQKKELPMIFWSLYEMIKKETK